MKKRKPLENLKEEKLFHRLNILFCLLLFLYLALLGYTLQFSFTGMDDGDSYYHTRMANLLYREGPMRKFPWTQFSSWKEAFHDKDFLFHVLLGLFCLGEGNLSAGGKLFIWILGTLFFACFAVLLFLHRFRVPTFWMLLLALTSYPIFGRIIPVRPQVLAMLFALLAIHLILRERRWPLFVLSFLFALSHTSAPLVLVLAFLYLLAGLLLREKPALRTLLFPAGGLLAGFIINPFFPHNFSLWYLQGVEVLLRAFRVGDTLLPALMGGEFRPISARHFVSIFRFLLPILVLAVLFGLRNLRTLDQRTLFLFLASLLFLIMGLLSKRFLFEYWIFIAVLFCASLFTRFPVIPGLLQYLKRKPKWIPLAAGVVLLVLMAYAAFFGISKTQAISRRYKSCATSDVYEKGIAYLRENAEAGEVIFHHAWQDFSPLFHFNVKNRYLVGLDPCYLHFYDEKLFRTWAWIRLLQSKDFYRDISLFGSRWAYIQKLGELSWRLVQILSLDPRFEKRYEDLHCAVFYLRPSESP